MNTPTYNTTDRVSGLPSNRGPFADGVYEGTPRESVPQQSQEVREVRNELRALRNSVSRLSSVRDFASQLDQMHKAIAELKPLPPKTRAVTTLLDRAGIEGRAATMMRAAIAKAMRAKKEGESYEIDDAFRDALCEVIGTAPWPLAKTEPLLVSLVGPSGVGKTTTSAKLAARFIAAGRTVTLVACDHFRVGAVHQLGRYAELMGARFAKAGAPHDLEQVIATASTNVIILDTAGLMPADDSIARAAASTTRHAITLLCMTASVRASDAAFIAKQFEGSAPTALCITKLDETATPAGLLHARVGASLPISTMCNGPRVPEDIAAATSAAIVDALRNASRRTT